MPDLPNKISLRCLAWGTVGWPKKLVRENGRMRGNPGEAQKGMNWHAVTYGRYVRSAECRYNASY